MFCALGVLLADSAAASGRLAGGGLQLHLRSTNLEFPRQTSMSSPTSLHVRGGGRHKPGSQPGFPASPPTNLLRLTETRAHSAGANTFVFDKPPATGAFRFEHSGGDVTKIVPRSYNKMCDTLSDRIWDDPKGKRVSFDMNGKPGIAIEIPIN